MQEKTIYISTMVDVNSMEEGFVNGPSDAATSSAAASNRTGSGTNRKILLIGTVAMTVVVALALGLGLGLTGNDDSNKSSTNNLQNSSNGTKPTGGGSVNNSTTSATNVTNTSNPIGNDEPITFASRLTAISPSTITQVYSSCDAVTADIKLLARLVANRTIESNKWFFNPDTYYPYPPEILEDGEDQSLNSDSATTGAPSGSKQVTESDYGTNNQVNGVEESDIVQSNGEQVFAVYGSEILVLDANAVTITSRTSIPDAEEGCYSIYVQGMLLIGERLVVITTSYCNQAVTPDGQDVISSPIYFGQDITSALIYGITDMSLVTTVPLKGSYIAARGIGDNVHVVTNSYIDFYPLTQYLEPWRQDIYGPNVTESAYRQIAEEQIEEHLDDVVQAIVDGLDCSGLQKIALFKNTDDELDFVPVLDSLTTVTSFSASNPSTSQSTSSMMLPSGGFTVYSSINRLILAVQGWWVDDAAMQQTYLISYTLDGPSSNATALGSVPGYILNSYSIDHVVQNGIDYLRVATTTFEQWAETNGVWEVSVDSTSQVTVLELPVSDSDAEMPVVGTLSNLGKAGETIYSVRFMGNRGFVTTFETTDPFYTLDLSDPANPAIVGELEIPGFSSYLHPIGNDLIIGVGQAADTNGTVLGLEISLFDVSDFSNPTRIENFADVGSSNVSSSSYSDAQYDYKAFRYLNDSQLLIIPVTIYNYSPCNYTFDYPVGNDTGVIPAVEGNDTSGSDGVTTSNATSDKIAIDPIPGSCYEPVGGFDGFRIYEITTTGITSYYSIEHSVADWYGCWGSAFLTARSLVFDGDILTLKGHSILSHDLSTKSADATPINLDTNIDPDLCQPYILF